MTARELLAFLSGLSPEQLERPLVCDDLMSPQPFEIEFASLDTMLKDDGSGGEFELPCIRLHTE